MSIVVREREGGRRYPFYVPGYEGPRLLGVSAYRTASAGVGRVLLAAIPRKARQAFAAPPGRVYLRADIDRCFAALLGTVAGDEALLEATRGDLHQQAGDALAPHLPEAERRRLGKRFNNVVIGLISPSGWQQQLTELGLSVSAAEAAQMHARWWDRFAGARAFRDAWVERHRATAAANRPLRLVYPDGRPYTFDASTVRGMAPRPRWARFADPEARLAASVRTSFSAIWRGIEGVVLDEALARMYPLREQGLRLVVPLYDGVLLEAPEDAAERLAADVRRALAAALTAVGIQATATVTVAPTWAGRSAM